MTVLSRRGPLIKPSGAPTTTVGDNATGLSADADAGHRSLSHDESSEPLEPPEPFDIDIDTVRSHILGLDELDDVSPRQSVADGDRLSRISPHHTTSHRSGHAPSDGPDTEKEELGDTDSEGKPTEAPPKETVTKIFFITLWKLFQSALIVMVIFIGLMSVFWGSIYKRETRYHNLQMLVVVADEGISQGDVQIPPLLGSSFREMLTQDPLVSTLGHYDFVNASDINVSAMRNNRTAVQEIRERVVKKYWVAFYVLPNATETIYRGFANADALYAVEGAYNSLVSTYYESGRHFSALSQYVLKNLFTTEHTWLVDYVRQDVYAGIVGYLTDSQKLALAASTDVAALYAARPAFNQNDIRPAPLPAVLGPSEIGLIYALVFSFHQVNFSLEIYGKMRPLLKFPHFLMWRFLASQVNCVVLALAYCLVTIAFQVPVNVAFGNLGFLVYWLMMYLFMAACGALNEFALTQILAYGSRALIPCWMVFSIIANISPVFAPFELTPGFYKYGYAMPMYNAYSALKVVFFDVSKSSLGRNLGILVAWLVVFQLAVTLVYILKERQERAAKKQRKLVSQ